jgi:hypothetical protein
MEVDIFLFGKPEWMIDLDKATAEDIRYLGSVIKERLDKVSAIMEKLENNGWRRSAGLYNIYLYKDINLENGRKELKGLDISEECISVRDDFMEYDNDEVIESEGDQDGNTDSEFARVIENDIL